VKIQIYKTINLSVVLYRFEIWFLILREKHKTEGIQNRVLRKIFGPKKDEIIRGRRILLATCSHPRFFLGLCFDPEDGGEMFLRNVS
jgi:hypothetical protein